MSLDPGFKKVQSKPSTSPLAEDVLDVDAFVRPGLYQRFEKYLPLFLVFLSGLGFSLQSLTIKKLEEDTGFKASFQLIFMRGFLQMVISSLVIHFCSDEEKHRSSPFGESPYIKGMLCLRSFVGFGGICFAFLAVENLPLGDSTVLVMLSPVFASIFSFFFIGEPFLIPEICATCVSLTGTALVARPSFLFGGSQENNPIGVLYGLIAAISAGAAYTCVRILGTSAKMPWSNVCLAQSLGQIILSMPCSYAWKQQPTLDLSAFQVFAILGASLLGAFSQIAMTVGMQKEKSATATAMRMSDVVFGYIWQVLFTNDNVINALSLAGAALIMCSILGLVIYKGMQASSASIPKNGDNNNASTTSNSHGNGSNGSGTSDGNMELRTYNVIHSDDIDTSQRMDTAIDISNHRGLQLDADLAAERDNDGIMSMTNDDGDFDKIKEKLFREYGHSPHSTHSNNGDGDIEKENSFNVNLRSLAPEYESTLYDNDLDEEESAIDDIAMQIEVMKTEKEQVLSDLL